MKANSVRWIYQQTRSAAGLLESGQKPTLCVVAGDKMLCVGAGHPVRLLVRPLADTLKCREVMTNDQRELYPVAAAAEKLWGIGAINGMTSSARIVLRHVLDNDEEPLDPNSFTDEEDQAMIENPNPVSEETAHEENDVKAKTKTKTKTKLAAPIRAEKAAKPAKAPSKRTGPTKKDRALELLREQFMALKPADRASPPRGFGTDSRHKVAKKLGWKSGAAVSDYYVMVAKSFK